MVSAEHAEGHIVFVTDSRPGEFKDRRDHGRVDCSQTIWIMATNALDDMILDFCGKNEGIFSRNDTVRSPLAKQLSRQLREGFLRQFGVRDVFLLSTSTRTQLMLTI